MRERRKRIEEKHCLPRTSAVNYLLHYEVRSVSFSPYRGTTEVWRKCVVAERKFAIFLLFAISFLFHTRNVVQYIKQETFSNDSKLYLFSIYLSHISILFSLDSTPPNECKSFQPIIFILEK